MYPRVKVRQQQEHGEQDDDHQFVISSQKQNTPSSFLLQVFDSLSFHETNSGKEDAYNSPPSVARISKSYVPILATPSVSISKGTGAEPEKNTTTIDNNGNNTRANPVLRPRAVLSSPENDGMLGNINKTCRKRPTVIKKHELGQQKGPSQGKIQPKSVKVDGPMNLTKGPKETNLKARQEPESIVTKQKPYLRKGKPTGV